MRKRTEREITVTTELLDINEACCVFGFGRQTLERVALECGAKIKIGKCARYSRKKLELYFENLLDGGNKHE